MGTACHSCGAIDPSGTRFRRERIPFRGARFYCPKCHSKLEERFLIGIHCLNGSFGLIGLVCLWLNHSSVVGHAFVNVFLLELICLPSVVIHEFAHAVTGRIVGLSVLRIWIGRGKTFLHARIFGFETEFKPIPFGGLTFLTHGPKPPIRLRYFLAILAGPVANALVLVGAWRFVSWTNFNFENSILIGPIVVFAQVLILIENILPFRIQTALGTLCSDGLSLLQLLFTQSPEIFRSRLPEYGGRGATYSGTTRV